jgi:hypothetical protein
MDINNIEQAKYAVDFLDWLSDNMGLISGYALAILAGIDKVALVAIKTMENIKHAWQQAFPKKPQGEKVTRNGNN